MVSVKCPHCIRTFDTIKQCRAHVERTHRTDNDPPKLADGGKHKPKQPQKARIVFYSGGIEFKSEPTDIKTAIDYAEKLGEATAPFELGERPVCDDHTARVEPITTNSQGDDL